MTFEEYKISFRRIALDKGLSLERIQQCLEYARCLFENGLPIIYDVKHFSNMVGYSVERILSYSNIPTEFYKEYRIPKKHGGVRVLEEPYTDLKEIQYWILEHILTPASSFMVLPVAKAFMPGVSLRDNARFHKGKKFVLAIDVEDFFGSVQFGLVYGVFNKMGYNDQVATLLTNFCMVHNHLPQGAPTSPMLSNLIFEKADSEIWKYCKGKKLCYTRYADDLTFSGDIMSIGNVYAYVRTQLDGMQMKINRKKTSVMGRGTQQNVTGVVVNEKLQVPRTYRDKIRQEMYFCVKNGIAKHMQLCRDIPIWITSEEVYIHHMLGKINFVLQINPKDEEMLRYKHWLKGLEI